MTDLKTREDETLYRMVGPLIDAEEGSIYAYDQDGILFRQNATFTRSDGSIVSRIYERLTKASRRGGRGLGERWEMAYRRGVYDAFKALQEELSA